MKRRRVLSLSAAAMAGVAAPPLLARTKRPLRIGLLPTESALNLVARHQRFVEALSGALARPVRISVAPDYLSTAEGLRAGRIDMAFLGPLAYVLLRARAAVVPLARPVKPPEAALRAVLIGTIPSETPVTLVLGDPLSTTGHLVPRAMMASRAPANPRFVGSHDAVAFAVAAGRASLGGMSETILNRLRRDAVIGSVPIVARSGPLPEYLWVGRPGFPIAEARSITAALVGLTDAVALSPFTAERFEKARPLDYDGIAAMAREVRLLDG